MNSYKNLTLRNWGYVCESLQQKISSTTLVIAGCGMGSVVVEVATRIGFQKFVLVDGDTVEAHNLNRQAFGVSDIGTMKVEALKKRILEINPQAEVLAHPVNVTLENVSEVVASGDIVIDTIDFLDLSAITALHDCAFKLGKPIISAMNVGFGSLAICIDPQGMEGGTPFRNYFGLPMEGELKESSYTHFFQILFSKLEPKLDKQVVQTMNYVFHQMKDGKPCPAPQVAPGSYATGALVVTMLARFLNGEELQKGPHMVGLDLGLLSQQTVIRF
ncbi:MAG: ThiF family adenylyltransferase [Bdellovibrionales bacterium]|nr:ThiF family adenylyltransferase [Bdellovibrionales bacterium]